MEMPGENEIASRLDTTLSEYVDDEGKVDYTSVQEGGAVREYVDWLKEFDPDSLRTENDRLAFWINTYNMLTVWGVVKELERDPGFAKKGNKSRLKRIEFFYRTKYLVGGRKLSLYTIENDIIRGQFPEPRIHFALNCASGGCPLLKDGLYSGEDLDVELEAATTLFVRSPKGARLDTESNTLHLSPIFKWYKEDFEKSAGTVIDFVKKYLSDPDREYIEAHAQDIRVKYDSYDWSLNLA
jgi:hypothetical protein